MIGRDLFIFAMLSPAELKRQAKYLPLTGSIPEEENDDDDPYNVDIDGLTKIVFSYRGINKVITAHNSFDLKW